MSCGRYVVALCRGPCNCQNQTKAELLMDIDTLNELLKEKLQKLRDLDEKESATTNPSEMSKGNIDLCDRDDENEENEEINDDEDEVVRPDDLYQ